MISFSNKGLIDPRGITTFGVSVKEGDDPIGYFGTGLKYAIAVALRNGCKVTLYSGNTKFKFKVKKRKMRGQPIDVIFMGDIELPFTTALGKGWDLWMAYREFAANAMDEEEWRIDQPEEPLFKTGYTVFQVEGEAFDKLYDEHPTIFLQSAARYKFKHIEMHDGPDVGEWLYYRGMRVYKLPKRAMYNYNILGKMELTEDRTLSSIYDVYHHFAKDILTCENAGLIRQMMEANQNWWESTIDYDWGSVTPGECFLKVAEGYYHSHTSYNSSAGARYKKARPEKRPPSSMMYEEVPLPLRRKLRAALMFWGKLGISMPVDIVRITKEDSTTFDHRIYLKVDELDKTMREVAGAVYKLYAQCHYKEAKHLGKSDFMVDTIVDFGERILGVSKSEVA